MSSLIYSSRGLSGGARPNGILDRITVEGYSVGRTITLHLARLKFVYSHVLNQNLNVVIITTSGVSSN